MLLLNTNTLQLCEFQSDEPPPYATFSARLNSGAIAHDELRCLQSARQKSGFQILQKACTVSQSHGLQWLWNDAACINRSTILSQSLNSLAHIYRSGKLCIVYLHDLLDITVSGIDVEHAFSTCCWIQNVWMLPHLIFSTALNFYDSQWNCVGSKSENIAQLSRVTSVQEDVLQCSDALKDVSHGTKMSWAAGLSADEVEDVAYSLLGIFNVNIPIEYGEGISSFLRLQEEVLRNTTDYSLLAWRPRTSQPYRGLLSHSPLEYGHFKNKPLKPSRFQEDLNIRFDGDGIQLRAGLGGRGNDLLLPLRSPDEPTMWIVLSLWDGMFVRDCTRPGFDSEEISNVFTRDIRVRGDVSSGMSEIIAVHRVAPPEKQISISGNTNEYSRLGRKLRDCAVTSHIAWSGDAVNSEAVQGSSRPLKRSLESMSCIRAHGEASPGLLAAARSSTGSSSGRSRSSRSDSSSTLDPGHPFVAVIGELTAVLVGRFLSTCNPRSDKRVLLPWSGIARKRQKRDWKDPFMGVELASDAEDVDTVVVHHAGERTSTFACPFYLMDKTRHEECLTRHSLSSIEDVRVHMEESHRRPNFCPICKDTFTTMAARDDHIRSRNCEYRDSPTFDGLTDGQMQKLATQELQYSSREVQWYQLWDVVSHSGPRPLSPFYSSPQEFRIVALRSFMESNGQNIISDFLKEKDLQGWEVADEERSLSILYEVVLHDAIDEVHRRFARGTNDPEREE